MAQITVTTLSDEAFDGTNDATDGNGLSLREAIGLAGAGDDIVFDVSLTGGSTAGVDDGTVTLSLGQLTLTQDITIDGDVDSDDAPDITISGNNASRVFHASGAATDVTLYSLDISNGNSSSDSSSAYGGAFYALGINSLTIRDSVVRDSTTSIGSTGGGGGVFAQTTNGITIVDTEIRDNITGRSGGLRLNGDTELVNVTVTGNQAQQRGVGGLSHSGGTLDTANVTIEGNTAVQYAGGAGLFGTTANLINTTITGNEVTGGSGGGIYHSNTLNLYNSLVLGNSASGADQEIYSSGTLNTMYSITSTATATVASVFDAVDGTTGGGQLADNGGKVQTVALRVDAANPALNSGGADPLPPDTQDIDGDSDTFELLPLDANGQERQQGTVDMGAVELQPLHLVVTTLDDELDDQVNTTTATVASMGGAGDLALREAVKLASYSATGGYITFDPSLIGGSTAGVDDGVLILDSNYGAAYAIAMYGPSAVHINGDANGDGIRDITISGDRNGNGVADAGDTGLISNYSGYADAHLTLEHLTLTNGFRGNSGGAVNNGSNYGNLTILDSVISNSVASTNGGGVSSTSRGSVRIERSEFIGNTSGGLGGGVTSGNNVAQVTILDSTFSGNTANSAGAIFLDTGSVVENVTIEGNTALYAIGGGGGAFLYGALTHDWTNVTVTGNTTAGDGGGIVVAGTSTLNLANSLVLGNSDAVDSPEIDFNTFAGYGGGLSAGTLNATNSIIDTATAAVADVFAGVDGTTGGGQLGNNGGPVQTVALTNSFFNPALDAGDDSAAPAADATGTARFDQVGVANNGAYTSDLGAVELNVQVVPPLTLEVTTLNDELDDNSAGATVADMGGAGDLSLREAVHLINNNIAGGSVTFASSITGGSTAGVDDGVISLTLGQISLLQDASIDGDTSGDDAADITISGNDASRVFYISNGTTDLRSLTLTNGYGSGAGGAIRHYAGDLNIAHTTLRDSAAERGGGLYFYDGVLTISNSTFSGNSAVNYGGGLVANSGSAYLANTTIHGNSVVYQGSGMLADAATVTIVNSTITGNTSSNSAFGLQNYYGTPNLTVLNSVVAENTRSGGAQADVSLSSGALTAQNSFFGSTVTIDTDNGGNTNNGGDPLLTALADNGGTVETRMALIGSQLVNAGDNSLLPADTLDVDGDSDTSETLPIDADGGARIQDTTVNIGASETVFTPPLVVTTLDDELDDNSAGASLADMGGASDLSLREALHLINNGGVRGEIIFDAAITGGSTAGVDDGAITLTLGALGLSEDVLIDGDTSGDNAADITISGNDNSNVFQITGGTTDLRSLTLTNGASGNGGGAIRADGSSLTVAHTTIMNSFAGSYESGGAIRTTGDLTVVNSTLTGNTGYYGGAINTRGTSTTTIINTTIDGNMSGGGYGGGILAEGISTVNLINSTVTGNYAVNGSNISNFGVATINLENTVVALAAGVSDVDGDLNNVTNSFIGTAATINGTTTTSFLNSGDPLLAALADNGGTVETRLTLAGSWLIDAGEASVLPADTLDVDGDSDVGETLPIDANGLVRVQGTVDIGASETVLFPPINGDAGNNLLVGTAGRDTINGLDGQDTIRGLERSDLMDGGDGDNDWVDYSGSDAAVTVDLSTNTVSGGHAQGDAIQNFERIIGSSFADTLTGTAGKNLIRGGDGADTMTGGADTDTLDYSDSTAGVTVNLPGGTGSGGFAAGDMLSGFEVVFGSDFGDMLTGGTERNILRGNAGADTIEGGGGGSRDFVDYRNSSAGVNVDLGAGTGSGGDAAGDSLSGLEAVLGSRFNDTIAGDAGRNVLKGMDGQDTFVFNTAIGGGNIDRLLDFDVTDDTIALDDAIFTALTTGALAANAFEANTTGRASTADVRIIYNTDNGDLRYDADGKGGDGAVRIATLNDGLVMTAADFDVI